ncbi:MULTISPECIES: serine/threonine-protein kinase [Spirulina sp. CCY15215]|uniref:serine/threonine protein kinase n=1 Tax=Spirulina sp. CCY15215 TaxID=2767591 RepID=UPI0019516A0D|nr:serine/threonine-protein kinase [Spirulina major]
MVSSVESEEIKGDRYRVIRELAQSSSLGTTYLVEDLQGSNAHFALKEFTFTLRTPDVFAKAEQLFAREADILYRLDHAQILKVHHLTCFRHEERGKVLLVQDYIEGQTLRSLLDARWIQGRKFSETEGLRLLYQLASLLNYIHSMGVIHRHISPENILFRQGDGRLILGDFGGIAQVLATLSVELGDPTTTPLPMPLGKPGYAPPEQLQKGIIFTYSDLYAIAATVTVMLTGQEPLQLIDPKTGEWDWHGQVKLSAQFNVILQKMLAKHPGDRYHSAYDVISALREIPRSSLIPSKGKHSAGTAAPPSPIEMTQPLFSDRRNFGVQVFKFLLQFVFAVGFIVGAGAIGWFVGQTWLKTQLSSPEELPELDISPRVEAPPPSLGQAEALSFPAADDPEPEPSESLPESERQRKLALRDRRLKMAIDYEFFQGLVAEEVGVKDAQKRGRTPSDDPKDAVWRETIDVTSAQLLDRLESLSAEARGGLGRYRRIDRDRWKREVNELNVSNSAAIDLADAAFFLYFPEWKNKDFLSQAIGQVWQAIALDKVKALQDGTSLQTLVFSKGKASVDEEGSLKPGEGKVFLARLEEGQSIATSVLTDQAMGFSVYTPNGEALRSDSQELNWSGKLPATGVYQIVIVSRSNETLSYKLTLTTDTLP